MAPVDTAAPEQLDFVGSLLVADTRAFVEAWREALSSSAAPAGAQLTELCERSKTLQLRARAAGVGGLAHHLGVCNEHAEAWDRERLEQCLADVLELAWQLSQEVERGRPDSEAASSAATVRAAGHVPLVEGAVRTDAAQVAPALHLPGQAQPFPSAPVQPPPLLHHNPWPGWKRVAARSAQPPVSTEAAASPPTHDVRPPVSAEPVSAEAVSADPVPAQAEPPAPVSIEATSIAAESGPTSAPGSAPATVVAPPSFVNELAPAASPSTESNGAARAVPSPPLLEADELAPSSEPVPSSRSVFAEPVLESGWLDAAAAASQQLAPSAEAPAVQSLAAQPLAAQPLAAEPPQDDPSADESAAEPFPLRQRQSPVRQQGREAQRLRLVPPRPAQTELAQRVAELSRVTLPAAVEPVTPPRRLDSAQDAPPHGALPAPLHDAPRLALTHDAPLAALPHGGSPLPPLLDAPLLDAPPAPAPPVPDALLSSEGAVALGEVLGLVPPGTTPSAPPVRQRSPSPPPLAFQPAGLPPLSGDGSAEDELTDQELEIRLERVRRAAPFPLGRNEVAIDLPPPSEARFVRRPSRARLWWMGPLALGVLGGVALLALLLRPWGKDGAEPPAPAPALTRNDALLPVQRLTDDREARLTLLALVQGGGKESNELSDLIREEVALVAKALVEPCAPGSPSCRLAEQARQMLEQPPLQKPPASAPAPLSSWLEGLRQPLIGIKDDPRVQKLVAYHTSDPVGRELFQGLLFRCGAYHGLFSDTLMQHGLPLDLIAVPMVESGCVLDAESPVGARGLWQFMPATARAYHLRVQEGVLDERLNPVKATDAALEFLRDLRSKLGSWELALASYNLGPFGLVSRLNRAGPGAGFWDLVDARRLPQETANYVPKIEAFALILANLEHFRFEAAQQMLGSSTTPLSVPAGTRLSQVARAVGSSASRIRELNPDLLADIVPGSAGEEFSVRVPSDGAPRAREALERLVARTDDADECVPANFDWGKQRLTKAMLSRCKR